MSRWSALALALGAALAAHAAAEPLLQVDVMLLRPACAQTGESQARAALKGASLILERACDLRLRLVSSVNLGEQACHLPVAPQARARALRKAMAPWRKEQPRALALLSLPNNAEESRFSYAWVDSSLKAGCDSPQEPRFLDRFGGVFVTDLGWSMAHQARRDGAAILLTHEILHALTHRAHPTGAARGQALADALTDMGPEVSLETCACARRSPYAYAPQRP